MMGLGRERRLNCRLYVDRQADAIVVEKLDRLLAEKHFLNQTELIKHGIELVYSEVYEDKGVPGKVTASGADAQALATLLVDMLKPQLQQMFDVLEKKIAKGVKVINAGAIGTGVIADDPLVEAVDSAEDEPATTVLEPKKKSITVAREEKDAFWVCNQLFEGLER